MIEDPNTICVRQHFEVLWNEGQIERIDEFFSPQFVNFGIRYSEARRLIQNIVGVWRHAFPDLHFRVDHLLSSQDTVMVEVTLTGTHLGAFVMIPPLQGPTLNPNGRKFEVKHIHRFRLQNARILEHFAVRDDLGMFQQLGHLTGLSAPRQDTLSN
jgi:predicted ester cyclase